nr:MAG TPA: hypothetical protein [Caudoviricetes sp.]
MFYFFFSSCFSSSFSFYHFFIFLYNHKFSTLKN